MTNLVKQGKIMNMKVLADNRRADFDYDIKETFAAGLILSGAEVKSIKGGNVSLSGTYINVSGNGAKLINCHIGPYKYAQNENYQPTQARSLLMNKKELRQLLGKEKGLVIVPLEIFQTPKGWIKIKIGIGRTRKKRDKREYIKKRDVEREIKKSF